MRYRASVRRILGTLTAIGVLITATGTFAQESGSIAAVACEVISTTGDADNREPNYRASADRAEFSLLANMRAVAEGVLLYAPELGGEVASGFAVLNGLVVRDDTGGLALQTLQIRWPLTVLKHEGQLYSVIQMAQDQQLPIGLSLSAGGNPLGDIELAPGVFDPNGQVVGFDSATAAAIHDKLMLNEGFSFRLMAGGDVFSAIEPDTAGYKAFIEDKLIPAMDEAKRQDAEDPCTFLDPQSILDSIKF
jgi:hypothetical protein